MSAPALILRPATVADLNLIRHDWFMSYRSALPTRPDVYKVGQNAHMARLIEQAPPIVASLEAVPEEIVGWVCREVTKPVTHYVYVKQAFRRAGIGTALVRGTTNHTHHTHAGELLLRRIGSLFNPFFLTTGVIV